MFRYFSSFRLGFFGPLSEHRRTQSHYAYISNNGKGCIPEFTISVLIISVEQVCADCPNVVSFLKCVIMLV